MKKFLLFAIILSALGSQSCLKNYGTIRVPLTVEQYFDVNLTSGVTTFSEMKLIDLSQDSTLIKYESNINEYIIKSAELFVTSYTGSQDCSFTGDISYSADNSNTPIAFASASNFKFYELFVSGDAYTTSLIIEEQSNFSDLIISDKSFFAYMNGSVTDSPINTTIKLVLEIEVVANILE
ncbi:MAG: hypothetical protein HN691_17920 [Bacteroidetes bacterium]|jgi:hypothetical protein|nr:hypothetical protein [Bacteroidota bacterium]